MSSAFFTVNKVGLYDYIIGDSVIARLDGLPLELVHNCTACSHPVWAKTQYQRDEDGGGQSGGVAIRVGVRPVKRSDYFSDGTRKM